MTHVRHHTAHAVRATLADFAASRFWTIYVITYHYVGLDVTDEFDLRGATAADRSYVRTLLEGEGLPSSDVERSPARFYVAVDGSDTVGVGGIETYGDCGLLRSVVVEASARGEGRGTALCDALEARAREEGVETLYLLTTTAAPFFADRGYVETPRTDVPDAIGRTAEFEDLCPAAATCMKKSV